MCHTFRHADHNTLDLLGEVRMAEEANTGGLFAFTDKHVVDAVLLYTV